MKQRDENSVLHVQLDISSVLTLYIASIEVNKVNVLN